MQKKVSAPLSVVITAFSPVRDVRNTLTPDFKHIDEPSVVVFVDLARGKTRIGGSVFAQCYNSMGNEAADLESCDDMLAFAKAMPELRAQKAILAYHDRSDGGIAAALAEMCFAGHTGVDVDMGEAATEEEAVRILFNEELGVAMQVAESNVAKVTAAFKAAGLPEASVRVVGKVTKEQRIVIRTSHGVAVDKKRTELHRLWAETSYRMQAMRDNEKCATQEYDAILNEADPGLSSVLTFDIPKAIGVSADAPHMAILREQGVNGHVEMAWAFRSAGFNVHDVHMSDILGGSVVCIFFYVNIVR